MSWPEDGELATGEKVECSLVDWWQGVEMAAGTVQWGVNWPEVPDVCLYLHSEHFDASSSGTDRRSSPCSWLGAGYGSGHKEAAGPEL